MFSSVHGDYFRALAGAKSVSKQREYMKEFGSAAPIFSDLNSVLDRNVLEGTVLDRNEESDRNEGRNVLEGRIEGSDGGSEGSEMRVDGRDADVGVSDGGVSVSVLSVEVDATVTTTATSDLLDYASQGIDNGEGEVVQEVVQGMEEEL